MCIKTWTKECSKDWICSVDENLFNNNIFLHFYSPSQKQTKPTSMSSNFAETSSSLSHPFISSTDSKMKKSSLKHRTHGGIHNIFDIVFKRRPQSGLFILYLFFMIFNSTKAADDTLYLYDDDFYDSYYYDDDYNSALTKYFKEEATNSGQQKSG